MQFGGSSWNNFLGFQGSSLFDQILESENTDLGTLLDDDRVLEELRRDNPKLLHFLNSDRVRELVELITIYPPVDADEKRGYKFPFMASEIFACESQHILSTIFSESSIFEFLLNFLTYEPFNSTLAGYFSKLILSLISKDAQKTISFMHSYGSLIKLCDNIKTKSISDIITKILSLSSQEYQYCLEPRKQLFSLVLDQYNNDDIIISIFLQNIFSEFIEKSLDINSWKSIFVIAIKEKSHVIFEAAQSGQPNRMMAALKFFKDFLKSSACDQFFDNSALSDDESSMEVDKDPELSKFSLDMLNCCQHFIRVLEAPPKTLQSTSKSIIYNVLGQERLMIIEFFTQLLKLKYKEVEEKFSELQIIPKIIDLFFIYEHNTFLQIDVEHLISYIFMHKGTNDCYIESLLQSSLFSHLTKEDLAKPYSGYLVKVFNNIEKNLNTNKLFEDKIRDLPEWEQFKIELEKINERNAKKLARNDEAENGEGDMNGGSAMNPPVLPTSNNGSFPMSVPPILPVGSMQSGGPPKLPVPFNMSLPMPPNSIQGGISNTGLPMFPGSLNRIPGPPMTLGNMGKVPGPPMTIGSMNSIPGPPMTIGSMNSIPGPPMTIGSMNSIPGPPMTIGSTSKIPGPPMIPNITAPPLAPGSMSSMHLPPGFQGKSPNSQGQPFNPAMNSYNLPNFSTLNSGLTNIAPPLIPVKTDDEPESENSSNKYPSTGNQMEIVDEGNLNPELSKSTEVPESNMVFSDKPTVENENRSKMNSIDDNPQSLSEYWQFGLV